MTTATKPLADHGTTARAKGRPSGGIPPCPCRPCRDAENAYDKRRRYLNATGRTLMVDTAPVADHIRDLFNAGAGWVQLAAATGCSSSTLHKILTGRIPQCRRTTANKILAVRPGDAIPPGRLVPAIGSIRRIRALLAAAHPCKAISIASGVEHSMISDLVNGSLSVVKLHVAQRIDAGYRKLAGTVGTSTRSRRRAERNQWAPPAAWDDLDNPAAHPEWTGHCGTDRGYWVHTLQKLAMCERCAEAHERWVADHAHLTREDRNKRLFAQRATAASREASLAEDARELLRLDIPVDVAAARLGVTRNHLQQAMKRHPERLDTAA
ncbi:helix-turn-helix domain-containing protein [Streptomyces wuyuanensis]|uniref:Uncharacterized protein n=1 Tax=Streptomyces wuyuanensis TaxID=1196353 RepID=A0A1G9ZB09_9ACTN|nr:helix-turn-helix transcriptional regulator [Streptomyces wuyuanensis]SDN18648.1 hypothetical protein SAMN05444921_12166 [Streptomyces wuyuanensis]